MRHRNHPRKTPTDGAEPPRGRAQIILIALVLLVAAVTAPGNAGAADIRLVTDNDFLADDRDDLYSFALGVETQRGDFTIALWENGFTDRAAGTRFDETSLTVGRPFELPGGWTARGELGVVHAGRGLLGESVQNALHRFVGSDEVDLDYVDDEEVFGSLRLAAGRQWRVSSDLALGPFFEVSSIPGLKSHALAAIHGTWNAPGPFTVEARAGIRSSHSSWAPLEPWMDGEEVQVELGVVYRNRIALAWSTNSFGTERDHVTIGLRVGSGSLGALDSWGR